MIENKSKKLYRSEKDRFIFGVCGGLGDYFNLDPVIVRILFIVLTIFNGIGLILYVVLALVVPEQSKLKQQKGLGKEKTFEQKTESVAEEFGKKVEAVAEEIESRSEELIKEFDKNDSRFSTGFGWILIFLGFFFLARVYLPEYFRIEFVWPLILIGVGFYILSQSRR